MEVDASGFSGLLNGDVEDRVEQARAAAAAAEGPGLRKQHQELVKAAVAGVEMLVAAPDAGTAGAADWSPGGMRPGSLRRL